jgi:tetratricopeptide (TPR) repeat protein
LRVASATETPPAKTPAPLQARRQGAAVPAFVDAKVARDVSASARAVSEGDGLLAKLRLRDAEDAFTRGLKLDPQNARAVAGLAHVSFERARYEEALGYARQAARLEPRKGQHRRVLGDAYFKLLRYREAEESYKQAQKLAPGDRVVAARLVELQEKLR